MQGALERVRGREPTRPRAIAAELREARPQRARRLPRTPSQADLARAAHDAVTALERDDPLASASVAMTPPQLRLSLILALCFLGAGVLAPGATWSAAQVAVAGCAGALALFRLACLLTPQARPTGPGWSGPLPVYTVILPVYREARVLPGLAEAIAALDYPRDRLDVKLVVEANDVATRAVADAIALEAGFEIIVAPPGPPQTKPRALSIALAFARGPFVTVYDAEDRPHPAQLRAALDAFSRGGDRLACVQAPLGWYNADENWLTRQFAIEYAAQFHVILPALARWGWALPLGGTSNHFRVVALKAAGGWDPFNVTEDADLGFRLAAKGWRTGVIAPATLEEATTSRAAWTRQRSRWVKGFLQTWLVRMRTPGALFSGGGIGAAAALHLTIGLSAASSLVHAPLIALALVSFALGFAGIGGAGSSAAAFALLLAGYAASAGCGILGLRRAGLARLATQTLFMPLYWLLHTPAALRAVGELVTKPHYWAKTDHGMTRCAPRTSASGQRSSAPAPSQEHTAR